jgi:hypothetical protein
MSEWPQECDRLHSAVADAVKDLRDEMLVSSVVIAVTVNGDGEKSLSCWTSPDQRHWETIGLIEYVRLDHGAYLVERRVMDDGEKP